MEVELVGEIGFRCDALFQMQGLTLSWLFEVESNSFSRSFILL